MGYGRWSVEPASAMELLSQRVRRTGWRRLRPHESTPVVAFLKFYFCVLAIAIVRL